MFKSWYSRRTRLRKVDINEKIMELMNLDEPWKEVIRIKPNGKEFREKGEGSRVSPVGGGKDWYWRIRV